MAALLVLCAVVSLAGLWHHDRWHLFGSDEIGRFAGDTPVPVVVRVEVLDAPRHSPPARNEPLGTMIRGETTRFTVRLLAIRERLRWRPASGRATLLVEDRVEADRALRGDVFEVCALLARVRGPLNPVEPDFARMCRGRREHTVLLCEHGAAFRQLFSGRPWSLLRQLGRFRLSAEASLDRHVGEPRSAMAAALVLGTRERLQPAVVEKFFLSGTLHLLAISGLHVGILATVFWLLIRLNWLPRKRLLWATCLLIVGYALLTGARPPVMRAAILVVLYCLARGLGRSSQAWNSLSAAGLVALTLRPAALFDAGTQLSFLAVATLLAAGPRLLRQAVPDPLERLVRASWPWWWRVVWASGRRFGQLLAVSAVIWLVSLPLVTYRFHLVAPIGLLLNVLLCFPVAVALFSALLVIISSPVPLLPDVCGAVCDLMLWVIESLTAQGAELGCGHWHVAGPPCWLVVLFYVGLGAWQLLPLPIPRRWWFALFCVWILLAVGNGSSSHRAWREATDQPLRLSFVAVGHGSSVVVELPGGKVLLYDAGRMGNPRAAALPISSVLWSRRIYHIDAIVLSHADADHFNAVPVLLKRFSVGIVYVSPVMFRDSSPALEVLRQAIVAAGVPIGVLHEGMVGVGDGQLVIEVVHPPPAEDGTMMSGQSDNANSVTLQIMSRGDRFLLTGDIEGSGLDELLAEQSVGCGVLMAPHHGSRHSRPADIVSWADPAFVIISAGAGLSADEVLPAYAQGGAAVFWTHRDGLVEVRSDGQQMKVSAWRE